MRQITLKPVGVVRNDVKQPRHGGFSGVVSEIVLDKQFSEGLDGIEGYSHVVVVYWMDGVAGVELKHRPQGNPRVPEVGIFACRCPSRPNPLAISTVRLIGRKGNALKVEGFDALDGSPVIDVKPYWPQYDLPEKAEVPKWVGRLKF